MIKRSYFVMYVSEDGNDPGTLTFTIESWFAQPASFVLRQAKKMAESRDPESGAKIVINLARIT